MSKGRVMSKEDYGRGEKIIVLAALH